MLTVERLKEVLRYDAEEGRFYWNVPVRGIRVGQQAGSFDAHGYGQVRIDRAIYKEHRLVWLYVTGKWPEGQIDHIDQCRRNNRFANLRVVSSTENHRNRPMQNNNKTGFPETEVEQNGRRIEIH